jgi:hypothetical protein
MVKNSHAISNWPLCSRAAMIFLAGQNDESIRHVVDATIKCRVFVNIGSKDH